MRKFQRRPEKVENGERLLLCTSCEQFKALDSFHLDSRSPSGRTNYCYPCRSEANKRYSLLRAEQREQVKRIKPKPINGAAPGIPTLAELLLAAK